jgi:hypothetical protein
MMKLTRARAGYLTLGLIAVTGLAAPSVAAHAEPVPVARHRVGIDLGVASAVGTAGVSYQLALLPWLRLEAGVGYGPTGTQLSLMPKVAMGGARCRFATGFGASLAVGGQQATAGHGPQPAAIPWLNLDAAGLECRSYAGLSFQAALGVTMPLADFHYDVADLGDTVHAGEVLPQGRVGIGWWF